MKVPRTLMPERPTQITTEHVPPRISGSVRGWVMMRLQVRVRVGVRARGKGRVRLRVRVRGKGGRVRIGT